MAAPKQPAPPPPEPPSPHHGQVQSAYQGAQISPAQFRPHADAQITQTVGMNPDPPADRQASSQAAPNEPYRGESPTGYNPSTAQGWDASVTAAM